MPSRLSLAHALRTSQTNLPIHVHGDDPPTLPTARRKVKGGRLLRRPQRDHHAATVDDFLTAVPTVSDGKIKDQMVWKDLAAVQLGGG